MSDSGLIELGYKRQTTKGVAATGAFQSLPNNNDSISFEQQTVTSGRRAVGRLSGAPIPVGVSATGEIQSEFSELIFDEFLEGAFAAAFDTSDPDDDTLQVGNDQVLFTLVRHYPYITNPALRYHVLVDCVVSSLSLTMQSRQIIGLTVGFAAGDIQTPTAAPYTSLDAPLAKKSLVGGNSVKSVKFDGSEINSIITQVDLDFSNNVREVFDVRDTNPAEQTLSTAEIGGTITALHDAESEAWFRKAVAGDLAAVEVAIEGETTTYRFDYPSVSQSASGPDGSSDDVTVSMPFGVQATSPVLYRSK